MPVLSNTFCPENNIMADSDEDTGTSGFENQLNVPLVAVPEKIVLCIDITQDYSSKPVKDGSRHNPFVLLKKSVANFIHNKHSFNRDHQFAVMSLEPDGVKWVHDFSSDTSEVINAVNDLKILCLTETHDVNLTPVFKEVKAHLDIPSERENNVQLPPYIVRLIMLYNSSYNIPQVDITDETFTALTTSKYFHWDILYFHEAPSRENKCQAVYNVLLDISLPGAYVFETSRKSAKLFNLMAKFLAHPLQRYEVLSLD